MSEKMQQPRPAELPETFAADFNAAKSSEVKTAMVSLGGFIFESNLVPDENTVSYRGQRSDGTTIEITFTKGDGYRPPAEVEAEANPEASDGNLQ